MAGTVKQINEDSQFASELANAGTKLVVVDYFATWCGPCIRIAPVFVQYSAKYNKAVFLKVDVDQCTETAQSQGVSAMPTFILYRNKVKIDTHRGADSAALEEKIKKWYGEGAEGDEDDDQVLVKGHMDLSSFYNKSNCECLNEADDHPLAHCLTSKGGYLESDCDEQLIISLEFNQAVKLHSLRMYGPPEKGPKTVKVFINQPKSLDFDSADGMEATQKLDLTESDLKEGSLIPMRFVKFQNVSNVTLFIKDNQSGDEVTQLDYLGFIGSPVSTTNMSDFKRFLLVLNKQTGDDKQIPIFCVADRSDLLVDNSKITGPFDEQTYEDEIDEDEVLDEEGRTRCKLKVENTIRWRTLKDEDGNDMKDDVTRKPLKESNARIVRWSDGSMSLHLGEEIFDIHTMPIQGDFNHLFVRQGTGLQGQSIFKTKLSFRPHSTESFTHRKMTLSLADRSTKKQKVKVLPIFGRDPESQRTEMIKKEEERLRASTKRESMKRRVRERAHTKGLSSGYLEGDEDYDEDEEVSINAIKNKYKQKKDRPNIYSSDSEDAYDSDKEETGAKRLMKAKKLISDDEESGSDNAPKKKRAKIADSSDEGEAGGSGASGDEGARSGGEAPQSGGEAPQSGGEAPQSVEEMDTGDAVDVESKGGENGSGSDSDL